MKQIRHKTCVSFVFAV